MAPKDEGVFEFAPEEQGAAPSQEQGVPPPVHNEIDVLVDPLSTGGRPRALGDAEAMDDVAASERATPSAEPMRTAGVSVIKSSTIKWVSGGLLVFVVSVSLALGIFRVFDPPSQRVGREPVGDAATKANARAARPQATPTTTPKAAAHDGAANRRTVTADPSSPTPVETPSRHVPSDLARGTRVERAPAHSTRTPANPGLAGPVRTLGDPPVSARGELGTIGTTSRGSIDSPSVPDAPVELLETDAARLPAVSPLLPSVALPMPEAPALAPRSAVARAIPDESGVRQALRAYAEAYEAMDVKAAAAVWPSVDRRALARAFATLKSQELAIDQCDVAIADTSATARCRGRVAYVRKVGNPAPRIGQQEWLFKMRKLGDAWKIDEVDASQANTTGRGES